MNQVLAHDLLSITPKLECEVPAWDHAATEPFCRGALVPDLCTILGETCGGGRCSNRIMAVTGTCSGVCACNFMGTADSPVCNGGAGTCLCVAAPEVCRSDAACGSAGSCVHRGACANPLTLAVQDGAGNTIPYAGPPVAHADAGSRPFTIYAAWTAVNVSSVSARGGDGVLFSGAGFETLNPTP